MHTTRMPFHLLHLPPIWACIVTYSKPRISPQMCSTHTHAPTPTLHPCNESKPSIQRAQKPYMLAAAKRQAGCWWRRHGSQAWHILLAVALQHRSMRLLPAMPTCAHNVSQLESRCLAPLSARHAALWAAAVNGASTVAGCGLGERAVNGVLVPSTGASQWTEKVDRG